MAAMNAIPVAIYPLACNATRSAPLDSAVAARGEAGHRGTKVLIGRCCCSGGAATIGYGNGVQTYIGVGMGATCILERLPEGDHDEGTTPPQE